MPRGFSTFTSAQAIQTIATLHDLLAEKPMSIYDIATELGMTEVRALRYVRHMEGVLLDKVDPASPRTRTIHVSGYASRQCGKTMRKVALYALGDRPDAPRPRTSKEKGYVPPNRLRERNARMAVEAVGNMVRVTRRQEAA